MLIQYTCWGLDTLYSLLKHRGPHQPDDLNPTFTTHLHGTTSLETSTPIFFNDFLEKFDGDQKQFRRVSMDILPIVEDVVEKNIGDFIGELTRRSIVKCEITVRHLRYKKKHIIHVNNVDIFFKCFLCPNCYTFFHKAEHFNRHLVCCKDRIKTTLHQKCLIFPKMLFGKLDEFNIEYSKEQNSSKCRYY